MLGVLFYSYTYHWFQPGRRHAARWRSVLNGAAFGVLAAVLMTARIQLRDGIYIDARAVPVALIALFEGWPAGLIAAVIPAGYRVWLGGIGTGAGMVVVVGAAVLGTLVHAWARRTGGVGPQHALALSGAVFVLSAGAFAMVGAYGVTLLARVWTWLLLIYVVGIGFAARLFHDVSEQARLSAAQERFRAVIDAASDAIRIVDPATHRILDVNRRDCELSGYSREDMIGRDNRDFWPDEAASRSFGLPYRTRAGAIVTIDCTRTIAEHRGRRYEIVVFREASERETREEARRESAELRAVTLLAGAAAHEINNPLAVIMGSLDLLSRHVPADSREAMWVQQALEGVRRVRDIVMRMTHITKVESTAVQGNLPPMLDIRKSSQEES